MRILAKELRAKDVFADGHEVRVVTRTTPDLVAGCFVDGRTFELPVGYALWVTRPKPDSPHLVPTQQDIP